MKSALTLCLVVASAAFGQEFRLGSKVSDIVVQDPAGGKTYFPTGQGSVTVVTFVAVQCPVSNAYNDRMSAIYNEYKSKGVTFVFVNANRTESPKDIAEHAKSVGFPFPVYRDEANVLADRFDAQVTPESYLIDKKGVLVYLGQVDDSLNEARVRQKTLRMALDAVLAGQPVIKAETKAFGCTIKRARKVT